MINNIKQKQIKDVIVRLQKKQKIIRGAKANTNTQKNR